MKKKKYITKSKFAMEETYDTIERAEVHKKTLQSNERYSDVHIVEVTQTEKKL